MKLHPAKANSKSYSDRGEMRNGGVKMCWKGEEGHEGYEMSKKECITSMARLSLTGKLGRAISETISSCPEWYSLIPYYDWNPVATDKEILSQISPRSFASQYDTLQGRGLSILLKKLQEGD